ncbi:MAG: FHA domain-containing protein [Chloroflexota bacterium]|nr:MAG: FHA domain-containing protein [Chloroflexota bacterium]
MSTDVTILVLRIAVIALLYFLIFQLLRTMRRDLRRTAQPTAAHPRASWLTVVEPGHSDMMRGDEIPLETVNSIGRAPSNTICVNDDFVSAQHAILSFRQKQWWLEDLGSTNGSFVNRHPVETPTIVAPGDMVEIGRVKLKLGKQD